MNALPRLHVVASPWLADLLTHLWQSTVVAVVILLLLVIGRRLSAGTRRTLGWIAVAKFAVPAAWLGTLVRGVTGPAQPATLTDAVAWSADFAPTALRAVAPVSAWTPPVWLWPWLGGVWAAVAAGLLVRWALRAVRVRRELLARARPVGETVAREVAAAAARAGLRAAPRCVEGAREHGPGALGIVSPVLILPRGLMDGLTPAERTAILIHECVHVRRRDNLWSAVRALFVGVLWFNPIAWLLNRALAIETEKSCDERVLEITGDADNYASGIVASVRHTLGVMRPGFAAATTPPVVARLQSILAYPAKPDRPALRWAFVAAALALVALAGRAGSIAATAPAAQKTAATTTAPEVSTAAETASNEAVNDAVNFLRAQTERLKGEASGIGKSLELEAATKEEQHAQLLKRLRDVEKFQSMRSRGAVRVAQATPTPNAAQPAPPTPSKPVYKIGTIELKFTGPASVTAERVLAAMQLRKGGEFDERSLDRDIRAIYGLGAFKTVEVKHEPVDGSTFNLLVELTPKPAVGALTEETGSKTSLTAAPPASAVSPLSDRQILEKLVTRISPTAILETRGKRILKIWNQSYEAGARLNVQLDNQDYELELAAIERTQYTLRFRGEEMVRPIASSVRAFTLEEGKVVLGDGSETTVKNVHQMGAGTLTLGREPGPDSGVTFKLPDRPHFPKPTAAPAATPAGDEELRFAQAQLATESAELKRLREERAEVLLRQRQEQEERAQRAASAREQRAVAPHEEPDLSAAKQKRADAEVRLAQLRAERAAALARQLAAGATSIEFDGPVFEPKDLDRAPVVQFQARPQYPFEMRRAGITGEVVVDFVVDIDGRVQLAHAIRSSRVEFEASAVQAVTKWKFLPGQKSGKSVPTRMQMPIVFTINRN